MDLVLPPDLERFLTGYVRAYLRSDGQDVEVDSVEPESLALPMSHPLIVVRDDSGARRSQVTFDRQVGVSILGGSRADSEGAKNLARFTMAVFCNEAIIGADGSPIASINWDDCNGPYAVPDEMDVARFYFTVGYTVVGDFCYHR